MHFELNTIIDDKAALILAAADPLCRGDVIPFEAIERIADMVRDGEKWSTLVRALKRRMLRSRRIALWPVPNVGYRLCTVDEQLNMLAESRQRRAGRQLSRTLVEVGALPHGELTLHEKRIKSVRMEQVRHARKMLKRAARHQRQAAAPSPTLPHPRRLTEMVAE